MPIELAEPPYSPDPKKVVEIVYRNHRNEMTVRQIFPDLLAWGSNDYYPEPQWLLDGFDVQKQQWRTFALAQIINWRGKR